jgi:stage III sporulation protein AB
VKALYLLRFVLCCMVVWCCGWVGRILSSSIRERPRQLLDLQAAVSRLETEINHSMTFLPEALQELARVTPSPVNRLFEDAAHLLLEVELPMERAWHQAVVGARQYLVLNRDDERILLNLGSSLGISPRGDQARHLTIAQELLKGQEVAARHVEQHSARLYQALGWAAGTALILMLI